jgi:hypothetical protein
MQEQRTGLPRRFPCADHQRPTARSGLIVIASMIDPHIAVVGNGSLARSVCYSLAALSSPAPAAPIRVTVLGRGSAASELARICQIRAAVTGGGRVTFAAESLHDEADALARLQPGVLVCCASAQSPYEKTTAPSAWTSLIARAGFGVTLPLQAALIVRLARAAAQVSPRTLVVNGCFPDVVNPLLAALKAPVTCGIGNVSTLAACLQAEIGRPDQDDLALLGHHVHLSQPGHPDDEVLAWYEGQPLPDVTGLLSAARAMDRRELNAIAGHAAARLHHVPRRAGGRSGARPGAARPPDRRPVGPGAGRGACAGPGW